MQGTLNELVQLLTSLEGQVAAQIVEAATLITTQLTSNHKVLCCSDDRCAMFSQYFSCTLLGRTAHELPSLPVLSLCASSPSEDVFARQVQALGQEGDVLLVIASFEETSSLARAIKAAQQRGMHLIALGNHSDASALSLMPHDIDINVQTQNLQHLQNAYLFILQSLAEHIDHQLFNTEFA